MSAGRPLDILLVEDNADARTTLQMLLELEGHRVRAAETGAEALQRATPPLDVALIDIGLPDVDGYDVARRIRATPHGKSAYLIALTGYGQAEDRRRAEEAGFDTHLVKPVDPEALVSLLAARA
ncbi:MAG TPA: response regulator [Candidatus Binatia bacterium]|nr:response regulator [Candidatus Binatia bacterium]